MSKKEHKSIQGIINTQAEQYEKQNLSLRQRADISIYKTKVNKIIVPLFKNAVDKLPDSKPKLLKYYKVDDYQKLFNWFYRHGIIDKLPDNLPEIPETVKDMFKPIKLKPLKDKRKEPEPESEPEPPKPVKVEKPKKEKVIKPKKPTKSQLIEQENQDTIIAGTPHITIPDKMVVVTTNSKGEKIVKLVNTMNEKTHTLKKVNKHSVIDITTNEDNDVSIRSKGKLLSGKELTSKYVEPVKEWKKEEEEEEEE